MGGKSKKVILISLVIASIFLWSVVLSGPALAACRTDTPISGPAGFYYGTLTVIGAPVEVGDEVRAYVDDVVVNGGCVGYWSVTTAGSYGAMPIYLDDGTTTEKDGAVAGDTLNFVVCHDGDEYGIIQAPTFNLAANDVAEVNLETCTYYYRDNDGDGFGDDSDRQCMDANTADYPITVGGDCDDDDPDRKPGLSEICDGKDNDCDAGTADGAAEATIGDNCDGTDSDLCEEGTIVCEGGALVCSDNTGDDLDVCDGADNDCDASSADGSEDPQNLAACDGTDSDLCTEGTYSCIAGVLECSDNTDDTLDICDGEDNDCNPATADGADDTNIGQSCDGPDSDLCEEGTYSCDGGGLVCSDNTGDDLDICDGADNDCDASSADGSEDPQNLAACDGTDSDLCTEGTYSCVSGNLECSDNTDDTLDICDGEDNDCNPATADGADETTIGDNCDGPDSDLCEEGTINCVDGNLVCSDDTDDTLDICDGIDNDCDASSDDGSEDPNVGVACDGPDSDLCTEGEIICQSSALYCTDTTDDTVEICDGEDNDCDGYIDPNEADADGDNVRICAGDCDDTDNTIYPGALDLYNGVDNDCDMSVDDDCYFDANMTAVGQDDTDAYVTFGLDATATQTSVTTNCSTGATVCIQLIDANAVVQGLDFANNYLLDDIRAATGEIQLAWYAEVDIDVSANPNEAFYYPQLQWDTNDLGCDTGFGESYAYVLLRGHGNNGAVLVPDMLTTNFYDTQADDNVAAEGETPVFNYTILFTTLTPPNAPRVSAPNTTSDRRPTWKWSSGGGGVGIYRIGLNKSNLEGEPETTANAFKPGADLDVGTYVLYVQERNSAGVWSAGGSKQVRIVTPSRQIPFPQLQEYRLQPFPQLQYPSFGTYPQFQLPFYQPYPQFQFSWNQPYPQIQQSLFQFPTYQPQYQFPYTLSLPIPRFQFPTYQPVPQFQFPPYYR